MYLIIVVPPLFSCCHELARLCAAWIGKTVVSSVMFTLQVEIHSRRAEYAAKIGKRGSIANATAQPAAGVHPPPSAAPTVVPHPHRPTAKSLSSVSIDCLDLSPPEETDRPNTRSPSQILGSDGFSPMLNTTQGNPKALRKTDMDRSGENLVALLATDGPMFVNNGSVTDVRGEGLGFDPQAVDVARVSPRGDTAQALTFKELAARSGVKQKRA